MFVGSATRSPSLTHSPPLFTLALLYLSQKGVERCNCSRYSILGGSSGSINVHIVDYSMPVALICLFPHSLRLQSLFFPCAEACARGSVRRRGKGRGFPIWLAVRQGRGMHVLHSTISRRVKPACVTNTRAPSGKDWGCGVAYLISVPALMEYGAGEVALSSGA